MGIESQSDSVILLCMQTYDSPNIALEAFKKELNQRKKTPEQIIAGFIKQRIITQQIADQLIQLAEYKASVEKWDNEAAGFAWVVLAKRAAHSPIPA